MIALLLVASVVVSSEPLTRDRYLRLVEKYLQSSLDPRTAMLELGPKHELERILRDLRAIPPDRRKVKAAALMHTETAFLLTGTDQESARDLHIQIAEALLPLTRNETFAASWQLAAGYLYQSALSPSAALDHFEKARRLAPAESALGRGTAYESQGVLELSQIPAWSVPELERTDRDRRTLEELRRKGRQRLFRAADAYSEAIDREPGSGTAYLRRGRCYQLLSRNEEALLDYRRALELTSSEREQGIAHLFLGELYGARGSFEEAASQYRDALPRLPGWQEPAIGLSYALQEQGRAGESREVLERILEEGATSRGSGDGTGIQHYILESGAFRAIVEALRAELGR